MANLEIGPSPARSCHESGHRVGPGPVGLQLRKFKGRSESESDGGHQVTLSSRPGRVGLTYAIRGLI